MAKFEQTVGLSVTAASSGRGEPPAGALGAEGPADSSLPLVADPRHAVPNGLRIGPSEQGG